MTATLTVVPNPAKPSTRVTVSGSGFANRRTRLKLDGAGGGASTFRPTPDGTFVVGIAVANATKPVGQVLAAEQLVSGDWDEVARIVVGVAEAEGPPPIPVGVFVAEYFANMDLSGEPAFVHVESTVGADWGAAGPGGLPADGFSIRYTGSFAFEDREYEFTVRADDGVRLFVDDVALIDQWKPQPATTYSARKAMTGGDHDVRVEYFEMGGNAYLSANWKLYVAPPPGDEPPPPAGRIRVFEAGTHAGDMTIGEIETWHVDKAAAFTGLIRMQAPGSSIRPKPGEADGGEFRRSPGGNMVKVEADDCSIVNHRSRGGGWNFEIIKVKRTLLSGIDFDGQTETCIYLTGPGVEDTVLERLKLVQRVNTGHPYSGTSGQSWSASTHQHNRRTILRDSVLDFGPGGVAWFGHEVWDDLGMLIEHNLFTGSSCLISPPRSDGLIVRYNQFDFTKGAFWGIELADIDNVQVYENDAWGNGPGVGHFIQQNRGSGNALNHVVKRNRLRDLKCFVNRSGSGHDITDNRLLRVANAWEYLGDGDDGASIWERNDANSGPSWDVAPSVPRGPRPRVAA